MNPNFQGGFIGFAQNLGFNQAQASGVNPQYQQNPNFQQHQPQFFQQPQNFQQYQQNPNFQPQQQQFQNFQPQQPQNFQQYQQPQNFQQQNFQPQNFQPQNFQQQNFQQFQSSSQMQYQEPARDPEMSEKIQLFISCRNLKNMDVLSLSDPCVVLEYGYIQPNGSISYKEIGRTEMIKDNLNPDFKKTFELDYYFEENQPIRFLVYDIDNAQTVSMKDDDYIGSVETTVAEIVCSDKHTFRKDIKDFKKKKTGKLIVRAEKLSKNSKDILHLNVFGKKLSKKDLFGKSDPYFFIERKLSDGTWRQVYKSEVKKVTLNPKWKDFTVEVGKLGDGPLRFSCFDWDRIGAHDEIGRFEFNLQEMLQSSNSKKSFTLIEKKKGKEKNGGQIFFNVLKIEKKYSFLDYIMGSTEVSLIVAIDFTGSNGHPSKPNSLHHMNPNYTNPYQAAIRCVGDILSYYDSDKKFPVFGFGAKLPNNQVSHCFALNGNAKNPECSGVSGILESYSKAIQNVQLYGPTHFAPVIHISSQIANQVVCQDVQKYFILLIITDGVINDFEKTAHEIVNASGLPLSIVIVGVGNADFTEMDKLDSDEELLFDQITNKRAERDIVQFVAFKDFANKPISALSRAVLAEIPNQFESYMSKKGIVPNIY